MTATAERPGHPAVDPSQSIEDIDQLPESTDIDERPPRQCKIMLSADAPRAIPLDWHPGGGNGNYGRNSRIWLQPGKSVVQPLWKVEAWFGPFTLPERFRAARSEAEKDELRSFWRNEKSRVLDRFDYVRPTNHLKDGTNPIGAHRLPHLTMIVIEPDGAENPPIDLHKLYKIGEFDEVWTEDKFAHPEDPNAIREQYEARLAEMKGQHESERAADRERLARLEGQIAAVLASGKGGK